METLTDNPQEVNDLAAKFQQSEITTRFPDSDQVTLPGGFLAKDGSVVRFAVVRELNGADEEAIARSSAKGLMLNTILSRGLVKLGHSDPSSNDLDTMLAGDREAILLAIRSVTFGKTVEAETTCPACNTKQEFSIDLEADVEVKELVDPKNDRVFDVDLKAGKAVVSLPNGLTQRKLMENNTKTTAELTTLFLGSCIVSINGVPSIGPSTAANLGIMDREKLVSEIVKRNPGPRLEAVVKACKACGVDLSLPLSLADLFRI